VRRIVLVEGWCACKTCECGLSGLVLDVPPTKNQRRVRQTLALLQMLDLTGRRAEDVQLLKVPRMGHVCQVGVPFGLPCAAIAQGVNAALISSTRPNHEGRPTRGSAAPMLQRCSSSPRRMPLRSTPSTSSVASSRPRSSCAGGSRASPGAGVRPDHRRLEVAAAADGEAHAQGAAVTSGALTRAGCRSGRSPDSAALRSPDLRRRSSDSSGVAASPSPAAVPRSVPPPRRRPRPAWRSSGVMPRARSASGSR
jgi:hypothetical protein